MFDMGSCGARLAFRYLSENNLLPNYPIELNSVLDYVEDRDLWRWDMLGSKEVNAAIRSYPYEFDAWESFIRTGTDPLRREGEAILRYRQNVINQHIENAKIMDIAGHKVPAVYVSFPEIISDVAGTLAEGQPFAACYFDTEEGRVYSLRSRKEGLDVSEIAKARGGGGHKHAAGFKEAA